MRPTIKNIENKGNIPAPQMSPSMGRLLCSPPDTVSLEGQPFLTNQTDRHRETRGRLIIPEE